MLTVNVTALRAHLKNYLVKLEQGEEITIIRNSTVIGHLVPSEEIKTRLDEKHHDSLVVRSS